MLVYIGCIVITGFNMVATTCPVGCQCTGRTAYCDDSRLSEVPSGLPIALHILLLSLNNISRIEDRTFEGLPELKALRLNDNALKSIGNDTLTGLSSLEELYLNDNKIEQIEAAAFQGLFSLKKLVLARNNIKSMASVLFQRLNELTELYLTGNMLTKLDVQFIPGLYNLESLLITNLCLSTMKRVSTWRKYLTVLTVFCICLFILLYRVGMFNKCPKPIKEYHCFEEEHENKTGLKRVHLLHSDYKWVKKVKSLKQMRNDHQLTSQEMQKSNVCAKNFPHDYWKGQNGFWNASQHEIRRTHHKYLVPGKSIVIEVGGNIGDTAQVFLDMYKPKHYVILEPLKLLHRQLLRRFRFYDNAIIYNIGLGSSNKKIMINIEGKNGVATSQWGQSGEGSCSLKVVNATQFFEKLGVGNFMVDLITINCEGCEYDLLETLLSTHFVYYFKNIQFGSHTKIKGLPDPVGRYCRLQQLLRRNHVMTYQHMFTWENWQLKDKFRK